MKKVLFSILILLFLFSTVHNLYARKLATHLAEATSLDVPKQLTIFPAIPKIKVISTHPGV
jgi:hypothetical protein